MASHSEPPRPPPPHNYGVPPYVPYEQPAPGQAGLYGLLSVGHLALAAATVLGGKVGLLLCVDGLLAGGTPQGRIVRGTYAP